MFSQQSTPTPDPDKSLDIIAPSVNLDSTGLDSAALRRAAAGSFYEKTLSSGLTLVVRPGMMISLDEFLKDAPPYSMGLDGYVKGPPKFVSEGPYAVFNHHEGVDRLATRCTSGQLLVAIKQGLIEAFTRDGVFAPRIYVNDPDQDSSLAVWLLDNFERVIGTRSEPLVNKLVYAEDLLDTTAGAYPFSPQSKLMMQLAWIFEPYMKARVEGRLDHMTGAEMADVISSVGANITDFTLGRIRSVPLDIRFDDLGGGPGWKLIKETGAYARTGLFASGTQAFVSLVSEYEGRTRYSIGKMSPYVHFPLEKIFAALNAAEPLEGECWGGSDIIGGSPRRSGSSLSTKEIERIINHVLLFEKLGGKPTVQ